MNPAYLTRDDRLTQVSSGDATQRCVAREHFRPRSMSQPQLELRRHIDAAATEVGNGQEFLIGTGRYQLTSGWRAIRPGRTKPVQLGERVPQSVDRDGAQHRDNLVFRRSTAGWGGHERPDDHAPCRRDVCARLDRVPGRDQPGDA
jgi:hypothetical protein